MAEILPIRRKTVSNQSINQSINLEEKSERFKDRQKGVYRQADGQKTIETAHLLSLKV